MTMEKSVLNNEDGSVLVLALIMLVLLIRPTGLFGEKEAA